MLVLMTCLTASTLPDSLHHHRSAPESALAWGELLPVDVCSLTACRHSWSIDRLYLIAQVSILTLQSARQYLRGVSRSALGSFQPGVSFALTVPHRSRAITPSA